MKNQALRRSLVIVAPLIASAAELTPQTLIESIQRGDRTAVAAMVSRGADVNRAEQDGTTALQYAAHRDDRETVVLLLRAGAKPAAVNDYGVTALSEAAATGDAVLVDLLLKAGADANVASPEGETVLMTAARAGNAAMVRSLIAHGAAVNSQEQWKGQTALMWAAAANHGDAAKVLSDHGADINARSEAVKPEVKHSANGNLVSEQPKGSLTPLLFAAREGAIDAARVLVKAGADLKLADPDGITPLIMAIVNGHYDVAGVLIENGMDPNIADKWGRTPLYAAVDMNSLEPSTTRPAPRGFDTLSGLDIARMLLEKGATPDPKLKSQTPGRGIPDGLDPLLRADTTPFLRAAKSGDVAAMKLLIAHGANPRAATVMGVNGLMAAAGQGWRYGDSQIPESDALEGVKYCLSLGLDINAVNAVNETALHGAADRGASVIVEYLAANGAKLDAKDQRGHTPLDIARGGDLRGHPGYPDTAALLEKLIAARRGL